MSEQQHLYRIKPKNGAPAYVAAADQAEAISKLASKCEDINPPTCSVDYVDEIYT